MKHNMSVPPSPLSPVYLSGHKINYHVGARHILKDITVCFQPNELVAVMGPSGGGKTTLINVLSGRLKAGRVEGTVLFGDKLLNPQELKVVANYVPQDDILFVGLTTREHLMFTAELRLPESVPVFEKEALVDQILDALSMQECADTIVGGIEFRGISGGQKKRCSVGMELVTNPSGLFLDEPTTGLDSKTAEDLIRYLSNLAHGGRTIVCSIHQPSPQVFQLFDRLVFLSAGRVVFDGPVPNVVPYFASIGHSIPPDENPADYVMEVVSEESGQKPSASFAATWQKHKLRYQAHWVHEREQALPELVAAVANVKLPAHQPTYPTSAWWQFKVLFRRALWNHARDIWGLPFRITMAVMGGMMMGIMFINMDNNQDDLSLKEGMYGLLTTMVVYDQILGNATVFPGERSVVMREYKNGYYRLFPYYASRMLMGMCTMVLYIFAMAEMNWALSNLRSGLDHLLIIYLNNLLGSMIASCQGMLLGVFVSDETIANILIPPVALSTSAINGFFVRPRGMPFYIKTWVNINYGSILFQQLAINEFKGEELETCVSEGKHCPYGCDPPSCDVTDPRPNPITGSDILQQYEYDPDDIYKNYGIMVLNLLFYFFISYYALRYRVRSA